MAGSLDNQTIPEGSALKLTCQVLKLTCQVLRLTCQVLRLICQTYLSVLRLNVRYSGSAFKVFRLTCQVSGFPARYSRPLVRYSGSPLRHSSSLVEKSHPDSLLTASWNLYIGARKCPSWYMSTMNPNGLQ